MMEIDIEDGDASGTRIAKALRRDRRIVEEAIAAIHVMVGVMAGRTTEGKGRARALRHEFLRGLRDGGRRARRLPGASGDAGLHRQYVIADLAVDMIRFLRPHAAGSEAGRDDLATETGRRPF